MSEPALDDPTLGELYDRLSLDEKARAFFFLLGIVDFYADGDTWFATIIIADPPAGNIMRDYRYCKDLDREAPGARARLAQSAIIRMFERMLNAPAR